MTYLVYNLTSPHDLEDNHTRAKEKIDRQGSIHDSHLTPPWTPLLTIAKGIEHPSRIVMGKSFDRKRRRSPNLEIGERRKKLKCMGLDLLSLRESWQNPITPPEFFLFKYNIPDR